MPQAIRALIGVLRWRLGGGGDNGWGEDEVRGRFFWDVFIDDASARR